MFLAGSFYLSTLFRTLREHDVNNDVERLKRLRSELGEWMRCGREVLNEANTNELEQFYVKLAKRSIQLEARDQKAFAVDEQVKEKRLRNVNEILLDARSNMKGVDRGILASEGGGPALKKARLSPPTTKPRVQSLHQSHLAAYAKLKDVFQETPDPSTERMQELAREFNLTFKKVNQWFGTQRWLVKKRKADQEAARDLLQSPFPTPSGNNDMNERREEGQAIADMQGPSIEKASSVDKVYLVGEKNDNDKTAIDPFACLFPNQSHGSKITTNVVEQMQKDEAREVDRGRLEREIGTSRRKREWRPAKEKAS